MSCGADGTKALNETFRKRTGTENALGEIKVGTAMDSMILDGLMSHFGIDRKEREALISDFSTNLRDILIKDEKKRILPGVRQLLELLRKEKNVYMGLLTSNFKVGADLKLESVGLDGYFSMGGYGDIYGEKWHAAEILIETAEKEAENTFEKENIYLIGDTWYDIECAKKIGIKSIAVATGWMGAEQLREKGPDYFFDTLEDSDRFFRILDGREAPRAHQF